MFWLIWHMGFWLLVAFALGLFVGRQVWSGDARSVEADEALAELEKQRRENENLARRLGDCEVRAADKPDAQETGAAETVKTGATVMPDSEPVAAVAAETEPQVQAEETIKTGAAALPNLDGAAGEDDLTRIKGLGPKAAAALADGGIRSFAQIAAWSAEDVAAWDEKINGRGRITRDNWVEQAKDLA